jgi:hypothetical protein
VALSTEVVEGVGVLDPTRVALHQLRVLPIGR